MNNLLLLKVVNKRCYIILVECDFRIDFYEEFIIEKRALYIISLFNACKVTV